MRSPEACYIKIEGDCYALCFWEPLESGKDMLLCLLDPTNTSFPAILDRCCVVSSRCFLFSSGNFPQLFFCPLVAIHPLLPSIMESMYIVIYNLASWHELSIQPPLPPSQGSLRENCCKNMISAGAGRYIWKG